MTKSSADRHVRPRRRGPLADLLHELSNIATGYLEALRRSETQQSARWQ